MIRLIENDINEVQRIVMFKVIFIRIKMKRLIIMPKMRDPK